MSTGCQTYVDIVQNSDPCEGKRTDVKCITDTNIYAELGLETNSSQEDFNQAIYTAFVQMKLTIDGLQQQIDDL